MKTILTASLVLFYSFGFGQVDTPSVMWNSIPDTSITINQATSSTLARQQVYKVRNGIDIPYALAAAGYTLYGFSVVYGRDKTPESVILALDPMNVNSFDRPATKNYSTSAKDNSDIFFYGSMPLPLILLADKNIRKDAAKVGLLYLQALSTTGSIYVTSSMIADRFRPYTYNPEVPMERRTGGGGKNSFFAGHPSIVATSTFFMAKVYSDYHPGMRNKWILYTLAGAASVTTAALRIKAGEHFYSDAIVGVPVGALTGFLIPHIHKNRPDRSLTFMPTYIDGRAGFYAAWQIK